MTPFNETPLRTAQVRKPIPDRNVMPEEKIIEPLPPTKKTSSRQPLLTVIKALDLLRLFNGSVEWLGVREISRLLDLNTATVHNLLRTLESNGLVEQNPETKKYRLGLGLVALAGIKLRQLDLVNVATPLVKGLVDTTGETAFISVLYNGAPLTIIRFEGPQILRVSATIGSSTPLHCTAAGRALLAYAPETFISEVLARPLERFTEKTLTDPGAVRHALEQTRVADLAVDLGENIPGVNAIAAPVRDRFGNVIACLGMVAPDNRMTEDLVPRLAKSLKITALQISNAISGSPQTVQYSSS
jgi:DNA-binding IclR family transcriptional regulator